jgi:hypothetical protein
MNMNAVMLNDHGQLHWNDRRWDVSRALQEQKVEDVLKLDSFSRVS